MKYLTVLLLLSLTLIVTGCNTMSGMGQDVERAGEEIQEGAE